MLDLNNKLHMHYNFDNVAQAYLNETRIVVSKQVLLYFRIVALKGHLVLHLIVLGQKRWL